MRDQDQVGLSGTPSRPDPAERLVHTLWLRYVRQMTAHEIAAELGISHKDARAHIKAVQRMLDQIDLEQI